MTISAIAVGTMSMLLFGEFVSEIFVFLETQNVTRSGHIALFRNGCFKYGGGNPAAYGIQGYHSVIRTIAEDPVLKPMINVVTPTINLWRRREFCGGVFKDLCRSRRYSRRLQQDAQLGRASSEAHLLLQ